MESDQLSRTPDLPQPPIIQSKQQMAGAPLGVVPKNRRPLSQPDLVGKKFGSVTIISPDVVWLGAKIRRFMHVLCECDTCGYRSIISYSNLTGARTNGCRACNQPKQFPDWLYQRVHAMKQRCQNKKDAGYPNYGGRGLQFLFDGVTSGCLWIRDNLGIPERHKTLHLDRIDNDGNYAPGNIRWSTYSFNQSHTRRGGHSANCHRFRIAHPEIRYSDRTIYTMIAQGLTDEQIIERYRKPSKKPKGKYGTFSIADPEIASLAKGS